MKKTLLSMIAFAGFTFVSEAQNVNIPDANFKAYLVGNSAINTVPDAEITVTEAAAFNGIMNCANLGITDLTGIEAFTGSFTLDCSSNLLTTLNLSANTGLYNILEISGNPLTSVVFPTTNTTILLKCASTPLTSIDVSNMSGLTHIWAMNNHFSSIDLSSNTALIGCNLSPNGANANPITTLDLTGLTNLQWLVVDYGFLTALDISPCTSMFSLDVSNSDNLASLNMANGNNMSFGPGDFNATNCPSLSCVEVDNVSFANAVWTSAVDPGVSFSLDCSSQGTMATSMTIQGQGGATTISTPGGTLQMVPTILPAAASSQTVYWGIASGSQFATISPSGLLTATGNGVVIIGALTSDGSNISANATITITNQATAIMDHAISTFTLYPNPATSTISILSSETIEEIVLFDAIGNLVSKETTAEIDVQGLTSGVYFITIKTVNGIAQQKFVKE